MKNVNNTNDLSNDDAKITGEILFKYTILLTARHEYLMCLENNKDIWSKLSQNFLTTIWIPKCCISSNDVKWQNLSKKQKKYQIRKQWYNLTAKQRGDIIKEYFIQYFCEQECVISAPLTPNGNNFASLDAKRAYQKCVTEYSNTVTFLHNSISKLNLHQYVTLNTNTNIHISDAQQNKITGSSISLPIRCKLM